MVSFITRSRLLKINFLHFSEISGNRFGCLAKSPFFYATIHRERSVTLANHKSALKRARQNEIRRMRNKSLRTRTKNVIKEVRAVSAEGSADAAREKLVRAQSVIDKAAKKGAIHKRTAARKIARLSRLVNKISA